MGQDRTLKRLLLVTGGDAASEALSGSPEMTAAKAIEMMDEMDNKYLTITDSENKALGYISRRQAKDSAGKTCQEILRTFNATATPEENLRVLLSRMYEFNTSWLPVLDTEGKYKGLVTQDSIADYLSSGKSKSS